MWRSFFDHVVRFLMLLCAAVLVACVAAQWRGGYVEYRGVNLATMRDRRRPPPPPATAAPSAEAACRFAL